MNSGVQCVNCANFTFKGNGGAAMARLGCGNCKHEANWIYYGATRLHVCIKFKRASDAVITARQDFLNNLGAKHEKTTP
jgi:hypothetical protein